MTLRLLHHPQRCLALSAVDRNLIFLNTSVLRLSVNVGSLLGCHPSGYRVVLSHTLACDQNCPLDHKPWNESIDSKLAASGGAHKQTRTLQMHNKN